LDIHTSIEVDETLTVNNVEKQWKIRNLPFYGLQNNLRCWTKLQSTV